MVNVLVEGEYFRVVQKSKTILAVEKKHNGRNYCLIAFIKPSRRKKGIVFEDINFRSIKYIEAFNTLMIEEFKNCIEFAKNALEDILCK